MSGDADYPWLGFSERLTVENHPAHRPEAFQLCTPEEYGELGVEVSIPGAVSVYLASKLNRVGEVRFVASGEGHRLFIDNSAGPLQLRCQFRTWASSTTIMICATQGGIWLEDVLLRDESQLLFFGRDVSVVHMRIELSGPGRRLVIGDDAMISSGVWIRNHDMHAIVDFDTMAVTNRPVDTLIERHVWLGSDALLLCAESIGFGSIVAAHSVVKGRTPPLTAVGGVPAKIIRQRTTWGRAPDGIMPHEIHVLRSLDALQATDGRAPSMED
jgi:hypothetical protein